MKTDDNLFVVLCAMFTLFTLGVVLGLILSGSVPCYDENQSTDDSLKIYPVGDNTDNLYVITGVGTGIDYLVEIKCIAELSSNPKSSYSPSQEAAA